MSFFLLLLLLFKGQLNVDWSSELTLIANNQLA